MTESALHFAEPGWFWALLALIPVGLWLARSRARARRGPLHRYADAALLPHLTGTQAPTPPERRGAFLRWCLLWGLLVTAMAGPRLDYDSVRLFHPGNNLLILLDISRSMQTADQAPNRLARARQEVADLIRQNPGLRLGLVAFASVPHVVAPLTEDTPAIAEALPALSTDLVSLQGSRLGAALDRAAGLFAGLPAASGRAVVLISDGDFDEPDLPVRVRTLAAAGIRLHVLGIGSPTGGQVPGARGGYVAGRDGAPVISRLDEAALRALAAAGGGRYERADYRDQDTRAILEAAAAAGVPPTAGDQRTRVWNERYWLPVILAAALLIPQFRGRPRGSASS